jgi:hypothetical protein
LNQDKPRTDYFQEHAELETLKDHVGERLLITATKLEFESVAAEASDPEPSLSEYLPVMESAVEKIDF